MIENCAAIVIAAKHHELTKVKDTRGTTNTVGALRCRFEFRTADWDSFAKTAMFCKGDAILHPDAADSAIAVPLDDDNECAVPYEVLTNTIPYSIGVWGATEDGLRIVSRWLVFNTQPGCYIDGNVPADPEPTIYDQILAISQNAVNTANDVMEMAKNGEFDGVSITHEWNGTELTITSASGTSVADLKGDKGDKGETGKNGDNGKDGVDGFSPTISVKEVTGGYVVSVTDKDGTKKFNIKDGKQGTQGPKGDKGADGVDGVSPTAVVEQTKDDVTITITDINGTTTATVINGKNGQDGKDGKDGFSIYSVDNFGTSDGNTGVYIEKHRFNISDGRSLNIGDLVIVTNIQKLYQITELEGYGSPDLIRTKYLCDIKGNPGDKGDPGKDGLSIYYATNYATSHSNGFYAHNFQVNLPEGRTLKIGDFIIYSGKISIVTELQGTSSNDLFKADYICDIKGEPGKSAYSYAKDGGYSGTEEEFAEKLAGEVDITNAIPIPTSAAVGQTVVVKTVDENGKPTEWKAVDIPEQVQTDWNQTDEAASDYIKNKPEIATDEDVMELITKLGYVTPVASSDGSIYIKENGVIYSL